MRPAGLEPCRHSGHVQGRGLCGLTSRLCFRLPQENYYRPPGQDACLPCDCFAHGSHSRACDVDSGQCSCKPGVIGRQCNRCDNPFAEVTVLGCEGLRRPPPAQAMGQGPATVCLPPGGGGGCAYVHCTLLGMGGAQQPCGHTVSAWLSSGWPSRRRGSALLSPSLVLTAVVEERGVRLSVGLGSLPGGACGEHHTPVGRAERLSPLSPVIYNGCPRAFEAGIWWPQTKFGQPAAVPCPKGSVGKYHGVWPLASVPGRTINGMGVAGGLAKASELTGCSMFKEFL